MNRRQLAFVVLLNAVISLVIALVVVWIVEARRPDPEALAAIYTPPPALNVPIAPTLSPTPLPAAAGASTGGASTGGEAQAAAPTAAPATGSEAAATSAATGTGTEYVVQTGDSLSGIADRFGVSIAAILEANNLTNPDFVFSGQRLVIPAAGSTGAAAAATPTPIAAAVTSGIAIGGISGAGDPAAEVVEVANDSDLAVRLQGWRLEREGGPVYTFGDLLLFPGSGVKVHSGAGTDSSVDVYWNQAAAVWASGAAARLVNPQGVEVARFTVP